MTPMERAMRPVGKPSRRPHPIEKMVGYDPGAERPAAVAVVRDGHGNGFRVLAGDDVFRPWLESTCTDVAVRTHVPVQIGLDTVLIPLADADRIMRDIAAAVWPGDPSPLEEDGWLAGHRPVLEAIEILAPGERDDPSRWQQEQALDVLDPTGTERRFVAFLTDASSAGELARKQMAARLDAALADDAAAVRGGGQTS